MKRKENKISKLTWSIAAVCLSLALVIQISCSHSSHFANSVEDQQINDLIDAQASMPPMIDENGKHMPPNPPPGQTGDRGKSIDRRVDDLHVPPCGEDSAIVTKGNGGIIYLHCGGQGVGRFQVNPHSMSGDAENVTVHVESYAFQVIGLDAREYHFGPDGLQFTPAATLMLDGSLFMNADGSPATEILWLYYNPHSNSWQLQNSITKHANGNFYIPVGHFSIYRAVTRSGVSISQGGQSRPNNR